MASKQRQLKTRGDFGDRKKIVQGWLARQKQVKRNLVDHVRRLEEENEIEDKSDPDQTSKEEVKNSETQMVDSMESGDSEGSKNKKIHSVSSQYKDQLMTSLPLTQAIPTDGEWIVRPCPAGERCLVVAKRGSTKAYRQDGKLLYRFQSPLPTGSKRNFAGSYCVFDCIAHEPTKTYFVLDMMVWNGFLYYDCTADFRFFFLCQKLEEVGASVPSNFNKYPLKPLPYYSCDAAGIQQSLATNPDLLLFNHKDGFYYFEEPTPLMCHLKKENFQSAGILPPSGGE